MRGATVVRLCLFYLHTYVPGSARPNGDGNGPFGHQSNSQLSRPYIVLEIPALEYLHTPR